VNLSVERDLTVGRNETVGSNLTVRGNESVSGNSSVGGNASVSGYLNVGVDADIGRYLDVGRDVNVGRNVKAEGYVSAGGVVESLLVRDQGEPCDAGQIARDESGNTLLCSSGVWTDALCEASRRMGQQLFTRDTFFKAPCTGDYTITVIGAGAGGEDAYTSDNSSTNCVHSVCPPDKDTTYSLSCGEDSCDLYSYTRTTNKCLCVDGKVLYNDGTGAGGSSAFYGPDTAKTILIIGGGGNGILGQNGQTGRMTQKMVKLEKDKIYTIKVGQPGQGDYGGTGYHDGQSGYPSRMATASGGDSTQGSQCPAFSGCGGYGAQGQKGFSRGQTEAHGSQGAVLVRMEYAKCPTGYTLDGSVCARTYTATYTASGYYCSSASYTLDETVSPRVCNRTYAATYKSGSYSCPSGGTLSGSTCTITTTATYTSTHYYCPSGGTLTGTTCRITRSTLFNG
jgi:cytoskeletal protein CcmA (bactofilin family)